MGNYFVQCALIIFITLVVMKKKDIKYRSPLHKVDPFLHHVCPPLRYVRYGLE